MTTIGTNTATSFSICREPPLPLTLSLSQHLDLLDLNRLTDFAACESGTNRLASIYIAEKVDEFFKSMIQQASKEWYVQQNFQSLRLRAQSWLGERQDFNATVEVLRALLPFIQNPALKLSNPHAIKASINCEVLRDLI